MSGAGEVNFGREAFKGFSAKVLMYLFGFAATAYFARVLGPASFGGYFVLLSVVMFVNRLPQGIGGACQKRISEVDAPDGELLGVVLGTTAAVAVLGGALAFAARDALASFTGLEDAALLATLLLATVSLYVPLLFLLCGKGRFGDKEVVELGQNVLKRPLQLGLVALGLGATGMALGRVGAIVAVLPVVLYLLGIRPAVPSRPTLASVWSFAKPNVASNVLGKAYTRFDVFLLGLIGATAAVGFYEVALAVTELGVLISNVVMDGLLSKVSALDSEGRDVEGSVVNTLSYTGVIAVPVFVFVAVLGGPVVHTVYGADYGAALPFVLGLGFYRIVQVQREALDSTLKGLDRPDLVFKTTGAAVTVNFLVGVPLLVGFGPTGVVVGTLCAELTQWALLHRALAAEGHAVPRVPAPLRKQLGSAALMGAVLVVATVVVPRPYAPSSLLALLLAGATVYVVGVVAADRTVRRVLRTLLAEVRRYLVPASS